MTGIKGHLDASVALLTADWPAWLPLSLSELFTDDVSDPPGSFLRWTRFFVSV
jgi:hypothetical protein